ncbi:MAG: hypothetical protein U1E36_07115 [Rickettsiales bacterium]
MFWLVVCSIAAGPSFFFGLIDKHDIFAMALGVLIFVLLYAAINYSDMYTNCVTRHPLLYKALHIGFGLRIFISLGTVLVMVLPFLSPVMFIDFLSGILSLKISQFLFGEGPQREFLPTLVTTMTQGLLLSVLTVIASLIIWALLAIKHMFRKPIESAA